MKTFEDYSLKDDVINNLARQGIKNPTPIQTLAIPPLLLGKDVIGESQTGTGKTLAFLIPIFQNLKSEANYTQALILAPTRELAIQITEEAKKLAHNTDFNILALYGGQNIGQQLKKIAARNIDIVIATPGRLIDHIFRDTIDLKHLKFFVLDEADQMLHIGFKNDVETILGETNKDKQFLCFSATLDSKVKKLAYKYMDNPTVLTAKTESVSLETIEQQVIKVSDRWKQEALFKTLDAQNPFLAIIFCRTKRRADTLFDAMKSKGYNCDKLHSDVPQKIRKRVMKSFRELKLQYLVATDVASRGLDITGVSHIYNYDMPETKETYIHRIGRTGRMGNDGIAITFVAPRDEEMLNEIEETLKSTIPASIHDHK